MRIVDHPADVVAKIGPSDAIVKNAWYLAAWSHELAADASLARRIANDALVLHRTAKSVRALAERCPHPRYHAPEPRAYPCVERHGGIWVFPGDPALADAANIPDVPWITEWWSATGMAPLNARASMLIDNLLDLSHETFLHPAVGTPEVAETPIAVERAGDVLWVRRMMENVACPASYANSTGLTSPIDRSQEIQFFAPGFYVLHVRLAKAGDTGPGYRTKIIYGITPETARTTHNFYGICRDIDRASTSQYNSQPNTVREDTEALERLERALVAGPDNVPEVSVGIDRGGLLGRQIVAEMLRREARTESRG